MDHFTPSLIRCTQCSGVGRAWIVIAMIAMFGSMTERATAGCHSAASSTQTADAPKLGLTANSLVAPLAKQCVYQNGVVKFYWSLNIASGVPQPCDGPGCRGKQSDENSITIVAPDFEREMPTAILADRRFGISEVGLRYPAWCEGTVPTHFSRGLFRPPRAA